MTPPGQPSRETPQPATDARARSVAALTARLWRNHAGVYWPQLALSLACMTVYAASTSGMSVGAEWIFSTFSAEPGGPGPRAALVWGPALVVGIGAVNAGALYFQSILSQGAALKTLRDLQKAMFASLLGLDFAQLRADAGGQYVSRFTNDATVLRETLTRAPGAARDLLTILALCATMIWRDWVLFLIVAAIYPLVGIPVSRIGKRLRSSARDAQSQIGGVTALLTETIGGARMVKTFRLEQHERARADGAFDERLSILTRMIRAKAMSEPVVMLVGSGAVAIVIAVAAWRVMSGATTGAQFVGFIVALLLLSQPARSIGTLSAVLHEGTAALERMFGLIDRTGTIKDAPDAKPLRTPEGRIEFRDVSFGYVPGVPALRDFSLTVPAGAVAALVGESGAGKSTVVSLAARLYDIDAGAILIDGQDVRDVTLASLRNATAVVSQDAVLFDATIAENIAFGRPGATREEIEAAARAAAADGFIQEIPGGYDARAGEGGAKLSGGQRQRIALARAFLKDAPILLLDEATSALDAESEAKVQEALARLTKGRTVLVIAHRLSTVRAADLICVMDRGRIVEQGRHETLIANNGHYARLCALQFAKTPAAQQAAP